MSEERKNLAEQKPEDIFKLGFGLMRLPKLENGEIDVEQTKVMVDRFLEDGGTYFDTAYVYDGGKSEEAIGKALVERHPRENYTLCTKMNAWLGEPTAEEAKKQFETSLERTGAGYFDYYLLHALQRVNYEKYDEYGLWDYVKDLKDKGLIKNYGFSFHADPELLEQLLQDHPDVDFIQLQINYADWENPDVASRACYEIARKHNKPIVVMEPVKGGRLADPQKNVKELLQKENPDASLASWAIRYVAGLPGIMTVLSGMSNTEQMEDNLSYMKDFKPLSPEEQKVIEKAQFLLSQSDQIPCTSCHYCTDNCPQSISIPEVFAIMNERGDESMGTLEERYEKLTENMGKASECVECLQCEGACPQHIKITSFLKQAANLFE